MPSNGLQEADDEDDKNKIFICTHFDILGYLVSISILISVCSTFFPVLGLVPRSTNEELSESDSSCSHFILIFGNNGLLSTVSYSSFPVLQVFSRLCF